MSFVGKYVCWGNAEGGFCFGRIESEAAVNTAKGRKEVFVLVDRLSRSASGHVARIPYKTTLRKEMIDLANDVFDRKPGFDTMTDEQLFLTMLKGEAEPGDTAGMPMGLANMVTAGGDDLQELAKEELEKRQDAGGAS